MSKRPAEFDAKIVAYLPYLHNLAGRMERDKQKREDLVADTIARALSSHDGFRADGGFVSWLRWQMHSVVSGKRRKLTREVEDPDGYFAARAAVPPSQEDATYLGEVMAGLAPKQQMLMDRVAAGWRNPEIGEADGVSASRVQQRVAEARKLIAANERRPLRGLAQYSAEEPIRAAA